MPLSAPLPIRISAESDVQLLLKTDDGQQFKQLKAPLELSYRRGRLCINRKPTKQRFLQIIPTQGHIACDETFYEGSLLCMVHNDELLLINELPLEPYICSVLHTESWPGWPLEVNKVFAIASRSYVCAMMEQAEKTNRPFHVYNSTRHQTYKGVHDKQILKDAVKRTEGMILLHDNRPIIAMFDSCCGGIIPAHMAEIQFQDAPYLARPYACTHCKPCWIYSWQAKITKEDFFGCFQERCANIAQLDALHISKQDKAGIVHEITLHQGNKKFMIDGKQIYTNMPQVKSFCFTITKEKDHFVLHGRGFGHHLGLCQWGAREMVKDGWDYRRILQFYYPKTSFACIS